MERWEKVKKDVPDEYKLLDIGMQKTVSEIAAKYPYGVGHITKILIKTGFNQEETENYIMRQLVQGKF